MRIEECVEKRYLVRTKPDKELIQKEVREADYDLEKAENTFREKDYKWSIVKSYYAMFHIARALLFKLGWREKRHYAVVVVLEDLNLKGKIESKYVNDFKSALYSREEADYHYVYSEELARKNLEMCKEFLKRIKELLKVV